MGLRSLHIPEATIKLSDGQTFTVRGISLPDVSILAEKHGPTLGMLYERFVNSSEADLQSTALIGRVLLELAPSLAVAIIVAGSEEVGDEESEKIAARLPFPVQMEALENIAKLTFTTEETLGNVIEIVVRAAESGMKVMQQVHLPMGEGQRIFSPGSADSMPPLAS